jgi:DNA-directed RNA polymerase specialized sigma subunit
LNILAIRNKVFNFARKENIFMEKTRVQKKRRSAQKAGEYIEKEKGIHRYDEKVPL